MIRTRPVFARSVALSTLLCFVANGCGGRAQNQTNPVGSGAAPGSDQALVQLADAPDGLDMVLTEGKRGPEPIDRAKLPPAKKLGDAETSSLFSRARPIASEADDKKDFALRPRSAPPACR